MITMLLLGQQVALAEPTRTPESTLEDVLAQTFVQHLTDCDPTRKNRLMKRWTSKGPHKILSTDLGRVSGDGTVGVLDSENNTNVYVFDETRAEELVSFAFETNLENITTAEVQDFRGNRRSSRMLADLVPVEKVFSPPEGNQSYVWSRSTCDSIAKAAIEAKLRFPLRRARAWLKGDTSRQSTMTVVGGRFRTLWDHLLNDLEAPGARVPTLLALWTRYASRTGLDASARYRVLDTFKGWLVFQNTQHTSANGGKFSFDGNFVVGDIALELIRRGTSELQGRSYRVLLATSEPVSLIELPSPDEIADSVFNLAPLRPSGAVSYDSAGRADPMPLLLPHVTEELCQHSWRLRASESGPQFSLTMPIWNSATKICTIELKPDLWKRPDSGHQVFERELESGLTVGELPLAFRVVIPIERAGYKPRDQREPADIDDVLTVEGGWPGNREGHRAVGDGRPILVARCQSVGGGTHSYQCPINHGTNRVFVQAYAQEGDVFNPNKHKARVAYQVWYKTGQ